MTLEFATYPGSESDAKHVLTEISAMLYKARHLRDFLPSSFGVRNKNFWTLLPGRAFRKLTAVALSPVRVRHAALSMLFSLDDDPAQPSSFLLQVALKAIENAREVSLEDVSMRMASPPYYPNFWPGQHYKLLAGFVLALHPKRVIDIGTAQGLSALSMRKFLPEDASLVTFDVISWEKFPGTCLRKEDFADGRLVQHVDDLSDPRVVAHYRNVLEQADLIFLDAEKDGRMEQRFIENFKTISFAKNPVIVFDDIRIWTMLKFWRELSLPKLDLTSFGHWLGTGIVEWK